MKHLPGPTQDAEIWGQEGPVSVEGPRPAGQLCLDELRELT